MLTFAGIDNLYYQENSQLKKIRFVGYLSILMNFKMENGEKLRYTSEELKEFEQLINDKLEKAKKELEILKKSISRNNDSNDTLGPGVKSLDDGTDAAEKESLNQLAARQQKFIKNLESAMVRIKNGTYGICKDTGKLISKERLKAVPHTMQSIEAKLNEKK